MNFLADPIAYGGQRQHQLSFNPRFLQGSGSPPRCNSQVSGPSKTHLYIVQLLNEQIYSHWQFHYPLATPKTPTTIILINEIITKSPVPLTRLLDCHGRITTGVTSRAASRPSRCAATATERERKRGKNHEMKSSCSIASLELRVPGIKAVYFANSCNEHARTRRNRVVSMTLVSVSGN